MLRRLRRFRKEKGGLAAVEFALIAPVMVTLLLGTVELCNALECHQKVTMLASTGADLVAQSTSVSASDMSNIFSAVNAIVYPFATSNAQIVISSIVSDGAGNGTVAWSEAQNTAPLTVNQTMTVPSGLMPATQCAAGACSVILAQVTYSYSSPMGSFILGTVPMSDIFYARPRRSATVAYTG
jgi:Flp pilus assembly protein TadG